MWSRLGLACVTVFFIAMNVLLWRAEFGSRSRLGGSVPLDLVVHKVLTAPDHSALEIRHQGAKLGYGTWIASIGEETAGSQLAADPLPPEGMVKKPSGYSIDFDGYFMMDATHRFRFDLNLRFSTNQDWEVLTLRLSLRSNVWEIQSLAAEQVLRLRVRDEATALDRAFKFAELRNPERLLRQLGGPLVGELLGPLGLPLDAATLPASLGLTWEARHDWLKLGRTPLRVYRVQTRILDRFEAIIWISRAGEIFRVDLPGDLVLLNDKLKF